MQSNQNIISKDKGNGILRLTVKELSDEIAGIFRRHQFTSQLRDDIIDLVVQLLAFEIIASLENLPNTIKLLNQSLQSPVLCTA